MPLSLKRPDIAPAVEAVVMRALHKDPSRRPQSALEFSREFSEAAGLAQPGEEEALASGFLPRAGVPLTEAPYDEATLVRKQQREAGGRNSLPEPVADIADEKPYDTNPEMPRSKGDSARFVAPRVTSADQADEAPSGPAPYRIAGRASGEEEDGDTFWLCARHCVPRRPCSLSGNWRQARAARARSQPDGSRARARATAECAGYGGRRR